MIVQHQTSRRFVSSSILHLGHVVEVQRLGGRQQPVLGRLRRRAEPVVTVADEVLKRLFSIREIVRASDLLDKHLPGLLDVQSVTKD